MEDTKVSVQVQFGSIFHNVFDGFEASGPVRQVEGLEDVREWSVPSADPLDRRLEMQETFLLDRCGEFSSKAVCQRSFVRDDNAAGFLDRLK